MLATKTPCALLSLLCMDTLTQADTVEKHCEAHVIDVGFEKIPDWPGCYFHKEKQCFLIVYVDDFKMSGPAANVDEMFRLLPEPGKNTKAITMDDPTPSARFLGCDHVFSSKVSPISGKMVNAIEYNMSDFLKSCVTLYCQLAGLDASKLRSRETPFVT